jgi:predicted CXXCH cytochrome family protein
MGLIVAPSCNDCHGVHDIKRSVDQSSRTNQANIAKTVRPVPRRHRGRLQPERPRGAPGQGRPPGPVCSDCHSAHQIATPSSVNFKAQSDLVCGRCHQDRLAHYRDTYHGKAMALGRPNVASDVAACYDCHGHHDVFPVSDPRSRLSKEHIVATCQQCHPGVGAKFTEYRPHADPLDAVQLPPPAQGVRRDDGAPHRRLRLLRAAHPALARALGLPLPERLEDLPGGEGQGIAPTTSSSRASRRSSGSCTCWW